MVTEDTVDKVRHFEQSDLPERAKVALRFASAIVEWPRGITPELRRDLLHHFTPDQIVELALDTLKWSNQKIRVALGIDAIAADGGRTFEIDPTGTVTLERPEDGSGRAGLA